jgi:4-hydroxy-tetrahydrodipicolinate synthase
VDRNEAKQLIQGPIQVVPTPFDENLDVDYGLMIELTQWWVESGIVTGKGVIKVASQAGEGEKLRESEWIRLIETVVKASGGKATVIGAIHHRDTVRAIEDAKKAQDVGVVGMQISPPIFNSPNQEDNLRFYEAVSDAIDIGIMIYNTPWWPYGGMTPETFRRMVDFEHIAAIKWSPPEGYVYEDIFDLADTFNIIDNSAQPVRNHKLGGRGYVQTVPEYPPFDLRVWELMEEGRYDEASTLYESVVPPIREFYAKTFEASGHRSGSKEIMALMGRPIGMPRPPSEPLDAGEREELRKLIESFGWPLAGKADAAGSVA